jgi:hypothetical protein
MHQIRKRYSDKYTDRDDLAVSKKSWPKASSTEQKRSTSRNVMHYMFRDASDEKVRPRRVHRQR